MLLNSVLVKLDVVRGIIIYYSFIKLFLFNHKFIMNPPLPITKTKTPDKWLSTKVKYMPVQQLKMQIRRRVH